MRGSVAPASMQDLTIARQLVRFLHSLSDRLALILTAPLSVAIHRDMP